MIEKTLKKDEMYEIWDFFASGHWGMFGGSTFKNTFQAC